MRKLIIAITLLIVLLFSVLDKISFAESKTHEDVYVFFNKSQICLCEPQTSTMYNESLNIHSRGLRINSKTSRKDIVSYARKLTKNNTPGRDFIRSDKIEDIVALSPYILTVEIGELFDRGRNDWTDNDKYYVNIINELKGKVKEGTNIVIPFFPDTVTTGERYIVALDPSSEDNFFWGLSSKNSVFDISRLDEILTLLPPF